MFLIPGNGGIGTLEVVLESCALTSVIDASEIHKPSAHFAFFSPRLLYTLPIYPHIAPPPPPPPGRKGHELVPLTTPRNILHARLRLCRAAGPLLHSACKNRGQNPVPRGKEKHSRLDVVPCRLGKRKEPWYCYHRIRKTADLATMRSAL